MAKSRPKPTAALTPEQEQTARDEVGAYYDQTVTQTYQAVTAAQAALAAAVDDHTSACIAETAWLTDGEITAPTAADRRLAEAIPTFLAEQIAASADGRAMTLAREVIAALYGDRNGNGRRPVNAAEHKAAEDAQARAELLRRWLAANTG